MLNVDLQLFWFSIAFKDCLFLNSNFKLAMGNFLELSIFFCVQILETKFKSYMSTFNSFFFFL